MINPFMLQSYIYRDNPPTLYVASIYKYIPIYYIHGTQMNQSDCSIVVEYLIIPLQYNPDTGECVTMDTSHNNFNTHGYFSVLTYQNKFTDEQV